MKRFNQKGFTIPELIAVIVIIGIVAVIATVSVNSISHLLRQKQYDNLIETIKTEAKKYKENTGLDKVYVKTLINNGYLTADDNKQNIYSPLDGNEIMNCYLVNMTLEEYAIEKYSEDDTQMCPNESLITSQVHICIYDKNGDCEVITNKWYGKSYTRLIENNLKIELSYIVNNPQMIIDDDQSSWTTLLAPDIVFNGKKYAASASNQIVNYNLSVVTTDNKYYDSNVAVKLDIIDPLISFDEENNKVTLSDNDSGLSKYCLNNETNCFSISGQSYVIPDEMFSNNGAYIIYVYDQAQNEYHDMVTIEHVDDTPPTCFVQKGEAVWTNTTPKAFQYGCVDEENGSGCATATQMVNYWSSKQTDTIYYTIYDKAGNRTDCSENILVYLDIEKPTVSISYVDNDSRNFNSNDIKLTITANDDLSQVDKICVLNQLDQNYYCYTGSSVTLDHYMFPEYKRETSRYRIPAYAIDKAGNHSDTVWEEYQVYSLCSSNYSTDNKDTSCKNGGTRYSYTVYDSYFPKSCAGGTLSCPVEETHENIYSCNVFQQCCEYVYYSSTGYQLSHCNADQSKCNPSCKSSNEGGSGNTNNPPVTDPNVDCHLLASCYNSTTNSIKFCAFGPGRRKDTVNCSIKSYSGSISNYCSNSGTSLYCSGLPTGTYTISYVFTNEDEGGNKIKYAWDNGEKKGFYYSETTWLPINGECDC